MARIYTRVYRLLRLVSTIQGKKGLGPRDLARLCEVHERTVYRDIDTLNASGFPCAFDDDTGGYRIRTGFFMPPLELTFEEAMALVAILEQIGASGQIPFMSMAARAAQKIRSQLPPKLLQELEPFDDKVHIQLPAVMADESCREVYETMRLAIENRTALHCIYEAVKTSEAGNTDEPFEFHPYALWFCQRAWYAVGHHCGRGEVRRLKLNRFTLCNPTRQPYSIPDGFDPRQEMGLAWRMIPGPRHRVAVCFEPDFAENAADTRWHSSQQEQWHDDGRLTLTFTVDGLDEIVWWVLGYGPGATVLEPPELVAKVRDLAQATAQRYARP